MSIADSRSFAADFLGQINGANGMAIDAALSEFIDNSRDAGSIEFCLGLTEPSSATALDGNLSRAAASPRHSTEPESDTWHLVFCDMGHGIKDIPAVFGLGQNTIKKSEGKTGLKNTGHLAAVSTFRPDSLTYFSKCEGVYASFTFDIQAMMEARDLVMSPEGSRDWKDPRLNIGHFMQNHPTSRTEEEVDLLDRVIRLVKSDTLRARFTDIRYKTGGMHFAAVYTFKNTNARMMDQEILKALNFFRLSYCTPLRNGFKIHYESLSAPITRTLDATQALSPLGDPVPTTITASVYKAGSSVILECVLNREGQETTRSFWASASGLFQSRPVSIAPATLEGTLEISLTTLSKTAEDSQAATLGFPVEDLRGIYPAFNNRILGLPYYDGKSYGARRNAGGVRMLVSYTAHTIAENYMAIQSHKHKTDLGNAHPTIKKFLRDILKTTINKFSSYNVKRSLHTCPVDTFYRLLLELPIPQAPVPPRPTPPVLPTPPAPSDEEDSDSDEEPEEDPAPRPPAPPTPPAPPAPAQASLILSRYGTQIRIGIGALRYSFAHNDLINEHVAILRAGFERRRGSPNDVKRFLEAYVALHS